MEDAEIIELYLERSESAIRETDKKYNVFLNRLVYNILHDALDTEEIIDDTYMGAWNAIPPTIPNSLKHFLSRIARNLSFDRLDYRLAGKRNALFVELDECIPDMRQNVERIWEAKEIGRLLNCYLGTLDRKDCAVFLGRYYYSCSIGELAKQYSLTQRQIKYMLSKARDGLRAYLEREGVTA
ncbi:MAG: sigma-70 family RNA polymerase sigma factor [Lachnospiraceae bacterium]|nr:sigma-70 family RNA polymerase sigma factor [Lachnospiraceae bacterium]MCM1238661.1 sigma-70 family RNA polymerase sigma factor [Lachnospiraceae bacterium]